MRDVPRDVIASASKLQARFGRLKRLLRAAEFDAVMAGRSSVRGEILELHFRCSGREGPARLGIIVPKRLVPTAVGRNSIKRQAREAFRLAKDLPDGQDFIFRLRRAPVEGCRLPAEVRREMDGLLARVGKAGLA